MHTGQNNHDRRTPNSGNTGSMQSYRGGSTGYRQNNNRSVSPRYPQGSPPLRNNSRGYATHGGQLAYYHSPSQYGSPPRVDHGPRSGDAQQHLGAAGSFLSPPASSVAYEHPLSEEEIRAAAKTLPPAQQTDLQAWENAKAKEKERNAVKYQKNKDYNLRLQTVKITENNKLAQNVFAAQLASQNDTMLKVINSQDRTTIQEPKASVEEKKKAIVDVTHDNEDRRNQDRRQRNDDDDNDASAIHPPAPKRACTTGNNVTTKRSSSTGSSNTTLAINSGELLVTLVIREVLSTTFYGLSQGKVNIPVTTDQKNTFARLYTDNINGLHQVAHITDDVMWNVRKLALDYLRSMVDEQCKDVDKSTRDVIYNILRESSNLTAAERKNLYDRKGAGKLSLTNIVAENNSRMAEDIKELKEEVKEERKAWKEAQSKITELQDTVNQKNNETNKALHDLQEKTERLARSHEREKELIAQLKARKSKEKTEN